MRSNYISTLYRGKSKQTNEWVFGNLVERSGKFYIGYEKNPHNALEAIFVTEEVYPESVGQYTGVHAQWIDKETDKIYESFIFSGDILEIELDPQACIRATAQVLCENGAFVLVIIEKENAGIPLYGKVEPHKYVSNKPIIPAIPKGNIFDNPITLSSKG